MNELSNEEVEKGGACNCRARRKTASLPGKYLGKSTALYSQNFGVDDIL